MNTKEIQNLIQELLTNLALNVKEIIIDDSFTKENANSVWYRVYLEEPHFFTSRDGEALSSLNSLVRRIIENKNPEGQLLKEFIIDVNNFQKNKIENLHATAYMMAERARYFKANVELEPMSPFERRIVHEFLADATDIKTESDGGGHNRKIIIKYTGGLV